MPSSSAPLLGQADRRPRGGPSAAARGRPLPGRAARRPPGCERAARRRRLGDLARGAGAGGVGDRSRARRRSIALRADTLGAVWTVTEERALREAAAVDAAVAAGRRAARSGARWASRSGWKDLIDTGGITTTYGSAVFRDHVPDARRRGRRAAARRRGRSRSPSSPPTSWPGARRPRIRTSARAGTRTTRPACPAARAAAPAVALAARLVAAAPGTDTGGSIRCPASCCGVVGLKPTFGRVSLAGVHPLCPSLDHCGPMGRSVRDCALQLEALAGWPSRDPRVVRRAGRALERGAERRSGRAYGSASPSATSSSTRRRTSWRRVRRAVDALADAGAELVEVDLEWPTPMGEGDPFLPEQAATLAEYWPDRRADFGPDVARDLRVGREDGRARLRPREPVPARICRGHAGEARRRADRPDRDADAGPVAASDRGAHDPVRGRSGRWT